MKGFQKGQIAWNKGLKMSKEFKEKCRKRQLGKKQSKETIQKRISHIIGIPRSEEFKKKIKENKERGRKIGLALKGKKLSLETIQKIKNSNIKTKRKFWANKEESREIREKIRKARINQKFNKISKAEKIFEKWLKQSGVNFISQWKYKYGIADFYIPEIKLVIECNGIYWHSKSEVIERDKKQKEYLNSIGINVLPLSSEIVVEKGGKI